MPIPIRIRQLNNQCDSIESGIFMMMIESIYRIDEQWMWITQTYLEVGMYTSSSAPIGFLMSQYLYWTCLHLSYRSQLQNKDKKKIFIDYSDIHDYSNIIRDILDIPMILYFKKKESVQTKTDSFCKHHKNDCVIFHPLPIHSKLWLLSPQYSRFFPVHIFLFISSSQLIYSSFFCHIFFLKPPSNGGRLERIRL